MTIQLAPEIEAGLRKAAQAQGVDMDTFVASALASLVSKPPTVVSPAQRRAAEMAWVANPPVEFRGRWVVLEGSQVVCSGSQPVVLYHEARTRGIASPFLIFASPGHEEPLVGGWID